MRSETIESGRFIDDEDVAKRRRTIVLGSEIARKLFGSAPSVGESVRIKGLSFEVVGLLSPKVALSNYYSPDKYSVFIPYSATNQLWFQDYLDDIVVQSISPTLHEQALKQVRDLLAEQHNFDPRDERAITINDSAEIMKMLGGITGGLKILLTVIGTLTLLIGGIGVMNIMLVSVTERTREIGVRKALGARRSQILAQFIFEAITITFAGGLVGILLSQLLVLFIGRRPFMADLLEDQTGQTDIHLILSPDLLLTATLILVLVGLLSGLWPALRASKTDPIDSLRYE